MRAEKEERGIIGKRLGRGLWTVGSGSRFWLPHSTPSVVSDYFPLLWPNEWMTEWMAAWIGIQYSYWYSHQHWHWHCHCHCHCHRVDSLIGSGTRVFPSSYPAFFAQSCHHGLFWQLLLSLCSFVGSFHCAQNCKLESWWSAKFEAPTRIMNANQNSGHGRPVLVWCGRAAKPFCSQAPVLRTNATQTEKECGPSQLRLRRSDNRQRGVGIAVSSGARWPSVGLGFVVPTLSGQCSISFVSVFFFCFVGMFDSAPWLEGCQRQHTYTFCKATHTETLRDCEAVKPVRVDT